MPNIKRRFFAVGEEIGWAMPGMESTCGDGPFIITHAVDLISERGRESAGGYQHLSIKNSATGKQVFSSMHPTRPAVFSDAWFNRIDK